MEPDILLKLVDIPVVVAIVILTEVIKRTIPWRGAPLIPVFLGIVAAIVWTDSAGWRAVGKNIFYYAGASVIAYETLRTTIMGWSAKAQSKLELPK
jgi:hypothetical protein